MQHPWVRLQSLKVRIPAKLPNEMRLQSFRTLWKWQTIQLFIHNSYKKEAFPRILNRTSVVKVTLSGGDRELCALFPEQCTVGPVAKTSLFRFAVWTTSTDSSRVHWTGWRKAIASTVENCNPITSIPSHRHPFTQDTLIAQSTLVIQNPIKA